MNIPQLKAEKEGKPLQFVTRISPLGYRKRGKKAAFGPVEG